MIRDAILDRIVELAHGHGELRGEPVALLSSPRIINERLDEDPVELESAYEPDRAT